MKLFIIIILFFHTLFADTQGTDSNVFISFGQYHIHYSSLLQIGIVLLLAVGLLVYRQYELKKINQRLKKRVHKKTRKLEKLNETLEQEVDKVVMNLREKDKMIAQQSKMAAMGEMLENIAHQWRQPLSAITTVSTGMQLQKEMGQNNEKEEIESFKNIADCAKQLSQTIDDFRNFFSSDKTTDDYNLKDLYIKSLSLIEAQFKNRNIKIIENIQDVTINILGNELIQVIVNILNNARDALNSKRQDKVIHVNIHKDELFAYIVIKDNAGGIKIDDINEVFEPYFTTKGDQNGTGIGLYMSKEIVTKHMEGELSVRNVSFNCNEHSCHGAEFTIKIPF